MAPLWTVSSNTNLAGMHPADRQAVIYGHAEQHRGDVATGSLAQEHWSKTVTRSNHTELLCFFWDTHVWEVIPLTHSRHSDELRPLR